MASSATAVSPKMQKILSAVAQKGQNMSITSINQLLRNAERPSWHHLPQRNPILHWDKPKVSLRTQADLRKTAVLLGLDPVSDIGLPSLPEKKPLRVKLPKMVKADRQKGKREAKIASNLQRMPEIIEKWRETKRQEKIKNKPDIPF
ncbi:hypothetical protein BKA69DRAFT_1103238 [Paraphysoderma sedebokerense]|nr:hypothetical protein BKA69DRAFT_1103238 [Paraphysoderma sedebokerense]